MLRARACCFRTASGKWLVLYFVAICDIRVEPGEYLTSSLQVCLVCCRCVSGGSEKRYEAVLPRPSMLLIGRDNNEDSDIDEDSDINEDSISPEHSADVISFVCNNLLQHVFLHGHDIICFIGVSTWKARNM
jgi:hypothetical protein